jgi:uncharacterized membrane protein YcaP (DUF421 family)
MIVNPPSGARMSDLFELAMPWWEFLLRAIVVYVVLLFLVRLSGKRAIGQYTPFDLVLIALLGNAVQNSLLGEDHSLLGGLLLVATLIGMNWLLGALSARSRKLDRVIAGEPVLLARDGRLYEEALRRQNISKGDFDEAMRESDCQRVADIQLAILETNGRISVSKRDPDPDAKPAVHRH